MDGRQDGHPDVDGVTPLGVQNQNFRLFNLRSFLQRTKTSEVRVRSNPTEPEPEVTSKVRPLPSMCLQDVL